MNTNPAMLLREFLATRSEAAFAALVRAQSVRLMPTAGTAKRPVSDRNCDLYWRLRLSEPVLTPPGGVL